MSQPFQMWRVGLSSREEAIGWTFACQYRVSGAWTSQTPASFLLNSLHKSSHALPVCNKVQWRPWDARTSNSSTIIMLPSASLPGRPGWTFFHRCRMVWSQWSLQQSLCAVEDLFKHCNELHVQTRLLLTWYLVHYSVVEIKVKLLQHNGLAFDRRASGKTCVHPCCYHSYELWPQVRYDSFSREICLSTVRRARFVWQLCFWSSKHARTWRSRRDRRTFWNWQRGDRRGWKVSSERLPPSAMSYDILAK